MKNRTRILMMIAGLFLACPTFADDGAGKIAKPQKIDLPAGCSRSTASHGSSKWNDSAAFVRCFSRRDIERTGATSTADALRLLDPSITVRS